MVALKHDSHEHELDVIEVDAYMIGKGKCGVCKMPIVEESSIYKCLKEDCPNNSLSSFFFLHKSCAELPNKITHPHHPQHWLVLGREYNKGIKILSKGSYPGLTACNICLRDIDEQMWNYMCVDCYSTIPIINDYYRSLHVYKFALCIRCAKMEPVLHHQGHQHHTLTLLQRPVALVCDACGSGENDLCYSCLPCQFWIHSTCAASPATIRLRFHQDDTLCLIYSIPHMYREFKKHCRICKEEVKKNLWVYFCEDSGYFVHMRCATTLLMFGENVIKSSEAEEEHAQAHPDLLQFPMPITDSLVANLLAEYQSGKALADNNLTEVLEIEHWSHNHPLVLLEEFNFNDDADSDDDDDEKYHNTIDNMLVCNGCTTFISDEHKYYGCVRCNYFLHASCANHLPLKFPAGKCARDPEHSLHLTYIKAMGPGSALFCQCCDRVTNGFHYFCRTCCKRTDIFCSLLPDEIKHDFHKHTLVQHFNHASSYDWKACNACLEPILYGFDYRCETCSNVQIHQSCAMFFPKAIRHQFDSHTISLLYPPIYYKGIKYCEICEMQVNPEAWLYWCRQCDQCFHPLCIRPWHNLKLGYILVNSIHTS